MNTPLGDRVAVQKEPPTLTARSINASPRKRLAKAQLGLSYMAFDHRVTRLLEGQRHRCGTVCYMGHGP